MIIMLSRVAVVLTEKKKKSRKKGYSETSSAIICFKKNILLLLFDCNFFDQVCVNWVQSRLNSCNETAVTVKLVTNNVCVHNILIILLFFLLLP